MLPIAPTSVTFSRHAAERYAERARGNTLTPAQASVELDRIAEHGTVEASAPPWDVDLHGHDLWLIVGDTAFPLERGTRTLVAVTCVTRGLIQPHARRARTLAHRQRRTRRAGRRRRDHDRRPQRPVEDPE